MLYTILASKTRYLHVLNNFHLGGLSSKRSTILKPFPKKRNQIDQWNGLARPDLRIKGESTSGPIFLLKFQCFLFILKLVKYRVNDFDLIDESLLAILADFSLSETGRWIWKTVRTLPWSLRDSGITPWKIMKSFVMNLDPPFGL